MSTELADLCQELKRDPIHAMSQNSKELFHSNLLAWLAERDPASMATVFKEFASPGAGAADGARVAQQEWGHLDLVLRLPGLQTIVIENKVWSLPDDEQLRRYTKGPVAKLGVTVSPILLSLTPPDWIGGKSPESVGEWQYLSYENLATRLEGVAANFSPVGEDGRFARDLLARYIVFLRRLCRVAKLAGTLSGEDRVSISEPDRKVLTDGRVHDGVAKLRARKVVDEIRGKIVDAMRAMGGREWTAEKTKQEGFVWRAGSIFFEIRGRVVSIESGFTNGSPLNSCDVWLPAVDRSGTLPAPEGDRLIWQYQGGQWRLAVRTNYGRGTSIEDRKKRHDYILEKYGEWCEDFRLVAQVVGDEARASLVPVKGDGIFHRFDPDFAYRYCKIDRGDDALTLNQLVELGTAYMQRAVDWPAGSMSATVS